MITGVETAGLILATVPLVIAAVEHYRRGLEPFAIWAKYYKDLRKLRQCLETEVAKLLNTLEHLLEPLVTPHGLAELLREPGGLQWRDSSLKSTLERYLGSGCRPFEDALRDFGDAINELHGKLEPGKADKTKGIDRKAWEQIVDRIKYSLTAERRSQLKETLRSSNKTLRELAKSSATLAPARSQRKIEAVDFQAVRESACDVHEALCVDWGCQCRAVHHAKLRLEIRLRKKHDPAQHAVDIAPRFRVLFNFDGTQPANIPWNWRETEIVRMEDQASINGTDCDRYRASTRNLTFPSPCISRRVRGDPQSAVILAGQGSSIARMAAETCMTESMNQASSTSTFATMEPPPPKKLRKKAHFESDRSRTQPDPLAVAPLSAPSRRPMQHVANLCSTIQQVSEGQTDCLGLLKNSKRVNLGLYAVRHHPRSNATQQTVRLADLLRHSSSADLSSMQGGLLTPQYHREGSDYRFLAVCLASTMLQLHKTPWLGERWSKSDILFMRELSESKKPMVRQPFISRAFKSAKSTQVLRPISTPVSGGPMIRNRTVFDLGVLLIELCLRKPLASCRNNEDLSPDGSVNMYTDFTTADRIIDQVYSKAGVRYGDAVRRCIRNELDQRECSLDNENFRHAIFKLVLMPLEDDLRDFCGGTLPSIE